MKSEERTTMLIFTAVKMQTLVDVRLTPREPESEGAVPCCFMMDSILFVRVLLRYCTVAASQVLFHSTLRVGRRVWEATSFGGCMVRHGA